MSYRELQPDEKPDYHLHDESSLDGVRWIETSHYGDYSIREMGGPDSLLKYRRPIATAPPRTSEVTPSPHQRD